MKNPSASSPCRAIWRTKLKERFNTIAVETLFKATGLSLIAGCEDGMVRIYDLSPAGPSETPKEIMETKSGPIQSLVVHDVTKFYHNDLIVADSCGMLTVFCNKQILSRQSLSAECLTCVTVVEDNGGSPIVVAANKSGVIIGLQPTTVLWRINLNSLNDKTPPSPVKISCLHTVHMTDQFGGKRPYIVAADNTKRLHFITNGMIVKSLNTPANVNTMTQGRFVPSSLLGLSSGPADHEQVALGCNNGAVYILHNFNMTSEDFINAKNPITTLSSVHQSDSSTDLLLCAGYFSALLIYKDGQLLHQFVTPAWVSSITLSDLDNDGATEVVLGCMDNSVLALKL